MTFGLPILCGQLRRTPTRQRRPPHGGRLTPIAFDRGHRLRPERPPPTRAGTIIQTGHPDSKNRLTPHADHADVHLEALRDPRIGLATRGHQHNLDAHHHGDRHSLRASALLQHSTISSRQLDQIRRATGHRSLRRMRTRLRRLGTSPSLRRGPTYTSVITGATTAQPKYWLLGHLDIGPKCGGLITTRRGSGARDGS